MDPRTRFPIGLLAAFVAVFVWSGIHPLEQLTWLLEVSPALVGLAVLAFTWRRFREYALDKTWRSGILAP